ncbi:MAG: hypothetical protein KA170_15790, partial [Candidatus Promineofilum sp.]|nr:hypothetical protein [Promineifilum sp.]
MARCSPAVLLLAVLMLGCGGRATEVAPLDAAPPGVAPPGVAPTESASSDGDFTPIAPSASEDADSTPATPSPVTTTAEE